MMCLDVLVLGLGQGRAHKEVGLWPEAGWMDIPMTDVPRVDGGLTF